MHRRSAYARRCFFSKEMPLYRAEQTTRWRDTPKKGQGVLEHHYTQVRTVYGERRSVKWAEFFAAEAAGTTLTAVFVLHADEYSGERVIEWNGNRYSVQRAYETGSTVELTVSDLAQPKGEAL